MLDDCGELLSRSRQRRERQVQCYLVRLSRSQQPYSITAYAAQVTNIQLLAIIACLHQALASLYCISVHTDHFSKQRQPTCMQVGVLPSGEAVCSVPNTLVALCLNNAGMERVRQTKALSCFVPIFTSKAYIKALQGDTPQALGAGLDELLRHVGTLRKEGVEMIVDILKQLCEMGGMHYSHA